MAVAGLATLLQRGNVPSLELLSDLLANALRRARSGRYDDALARLYRGLELAAEADIYQRQGLVLRRPDTYPQPLASLATRAGKALGLKEVLGLAFEVDTHLGSSNTLAQRLYGDYSAKLQSLMQARHNSILAHGVKPVAPESFQALWQYFAELGLGAAPEWPSW